MRPVKNSHVRRLPCLIVGEEDSILAGQTNQDGLYAEALDQFGPALERLVRAYESDSDKRRDLSQDVHFQLWRSLQNYNSRSSLRTWVYRGGSPRRCFTHYPRT